MEWKFEEQFMMDQWDKWMRWILERRGSLPRDCFENFLEEVIDLQAKHDELKESVACFFAIQDAMIWGRPIYGNASIRLMERNRLSKALRKAVEG
jgi:hypothetical protein